MKPKLFNLVNIALSTATAAFVLLLVACPKSCPSFDVVVRDQTHNFSAGTFTTNPRGFFIRASTGTGGNADFVEITIPVQGGFSGSPGNFQIPSGSPQTSTGGAELKLGSQDFIAQAGRVFITESSATVVKGTYGFTGHDAVHAVTLPIEGSFCITDIRHR